MPDFGGIVQALVTIGILIGLVIGGALFGVGYGARYVWTHYHVVKVEAPR